MNWEDILREIFWKAALSWAKEAWVRPGGNSVEVSGADKQERNVRRSGGTTPALHLTHPEAHQNMALEGKEASASGHGFWKRQKARRNQM